MNELKNSNTTGSYSPKMNIHSSVMKTLLVLTLFGFSPDKQGETVSGNDNMETVIACPQEDIISSAIKNTLINSNNIWEFPKKIVYTQKNRDTSCYFPDVLDINPKYIREPVETITITIGKRSFQVGPVLGNIKNVYLDKTSLVIETTFKDLNYSKHEKLPELCLKLLATPVEKGEKSGFFGANVTEI